jgi:hypothetical protein
MKFARYVLVALMLAACSPGGGDQADAPAPSGPSEGRLTPASNNAQSETGFIDYSGGDLMTASAITLTTERGQTYSLAFVGDVSAGDTFDGQTTWDTALNQPEAPLRLFSATASDSSNNDFCEASTTYIAIAKRDNDVRLLPFSSSSAPSESAPAPACGLFLYTR